MKYKSGIKAYYASSIGGTVDVETQSSSDNLQTIQIKVGDGHTVVAVGTPSVSVTIGFPSIGISFSYQQKNLINSVETFKYSDYGIVTA